MSNPITEWQEKRARQREQLEEAERERTNEQLRTKARRAYMTAGGSDRGFEQEWPELRRELLREQTIQSVREGKQ
jgi:hypothetical protein